MKTQSSESLVKPWNQEPPTLSGWRLGVLNFSLMIGFFLAILDTTIIATALYSISTEFGSLSVTFWVVLAYTLAYVSFVTVFARISDFIGRRYSVLIAFSTFVGASLGCGWSKDLSTLIGLRALQGIGGAGLFSMALTVILEISPPARRALLSGLVGITLAVAGAVGPLLGGELSQHVTWRWVFWINGPTGLLGIALFTIGWPKSYEFDRVRRPWKEFDWVGTILLMAASVLVVFGLQQAAEGDIAWGSAETIATIVVGGVCWIALFIYQYSIRRTSLAATLPFQFLRNRALASAFFFTLLAGFVGSTAIYTVPLRFQIVNGQSPSQAGVKLLPLLGASAFGSFVGGAVNTKRNNVVYTLLVAASLMLLGAGLFTTLSESFVVEAKDYGFQVILGFGSGMTASTVSLMASLEAQPQDRAVSQGLGGQARILGSSIGVAAANGLNARQLSHLAEKLPSAVLGLIRGNISAIDTLERGQQEIIRGAYSNGFTDMMKLSMYVAVISLVFAGLTWQRNPAQLIRHVEQVKEVTETKVVDTAEEEKIMMCQRAGSQELDV